MDLNNLIGKKQEVSIDEEAPRLSKEEYAAVKQAEREAVWAEVDGVASEVLQSDESLRGFLDFTAACAPQRTANLLLLYKQNPEVKQVKTFEGWKEAGRSVRGNEHGYTFLLGQEYEREDGVLAKGYTIGKVFDISQTNGRQPQPSPKYLPEELLAAAISESHVPLEIADNLPENVQAQYVPKSKTIYVKNVACRHSSPYQALKCLIPLVSSKAPPEPLSLRDRTTDENATFFAIAREQAHASFDLGGGSYSRAQFSASAYCAAYVAGQKYGIDTAMFNFDKVCELYGSLDPKEQRLFLGDVKSAAYTITKKIDHSLSEPEQTLVADEYSVEKKQAAEKAAPAPEKSVTEKPSQTAEKATALKQPVPKQQGAKTKAEKEVQR